jgi:hypothetical protein
VTTPADDAQAESENTSMRCEKELNVAASTATAAAAPANANRSILWRSPAAERFCEQELFSSFEQYCVHRRGRMLR